MEISPAAHMGLVELSVSDLDRSLGYWQDAIGLRVLSRENGTAELGADTPLLRFVEEPARARPTATPASSTWRCSCRIARASAASSRTPPASSSHSPGFPTTS
jgi:catechol 2,3-dioxygenase-like lactoylglutathione lyase family enzyme